jgi:hypothetical protein
MYNNKSYRTGTEIIYNGKCKMNGETIFLNNQKCKFLYLYDQYYLKVNETTCACDIIDFNKNIVAIVDSAKKEEEEEKQNLYFTDDMIVITFWYIAAMIVGILFKDRLTLWLLSTILYVSYIRRKLK